MTQFSFDDDSRHVRLNVPLNVPLYVPVHRPVSGEDEPPDGGVVAEVDPSGGVVEVDVVVPLEFELHAAAARTSTTRDVDRTIPSLPFILCPLRTMRCSFRPSTAALGLP